MRRFYECSEQRTKVVTHDISSLVGWVSSALLIATLAMQLRKQWIEGDSRAISMWLFGGQFFAEIGFVIYSVSVESWIFAFTNSILVVENILGFILTQHFKKFPR